MRSRSSGHFAVGVGSSVLGAAALALGVFRIGPLEGAFLGTPLWAIALTAGSVLALAGVLVVVFTYRKEEESPEVVPAHVAFHTRMSAAPLVPPGPAPRPAAVAPAGPRLPAPEPVAQRRVAPPRTDLASLDVQIRELSKKINQAGVKLATGQLSQQGYLAYVEDLKRERAKLEAHKVRVELKG